MTITARLAHIMRNTSETQISIALNLDGTGRAELNTGVPFLDHMLDQIARHGLMDVSVTAKGDAATLKKIKSAGFADAYMLK